MCSLYSQQASAVSSFWMWSSQLVRVLLHSFVFSCVLVLPHLIFAAQRKVVLHINNSAMQAGIGVSVFLFMFLCCLDYSEL